MLEPQEREAVSAVFKALAHPVRLGIIDLLRKDELGACEIASAFPQFDRTTISKHLTKMRDLGILLDRREGVNIKYRLAMACIPPVLACIAERVRLRE